MLKTHQYLTGAKQENNSYIDNPNSAQVLCKRHQMKSDVQVLWGCSGANADDPKFIMCCQSVSCL